MPPPPPQLQTLPAGTLMLFHRAASDVDHFCVGVILGNTPLAEALHNTASLVTGAAFFSYCSDIRVLRLRERWCRAARCETAGA